MGPNQGIDIIIPIYNALSELTTCIDSIKKHTDLSFHRLILINDASPDPQIQPYLNSLSDPHILVFHNENNLGFSATVNRGIQLSERDVLLLNSDTVVTKDWLKKILACAWSDESIGTVTPLSNNATICSVPGFCQNNSLPEGYTIDTYADLIESISLEKYPTIPVAHGFCMFIKRCVIRMIGMFDSHTFGRGYGEENDFCFRAELFGYRHALCDNTYVYHSGTHSFDSKEKKEYSQTHEKILKKRYPVQMQNLNFFLRDNPNNEIWENIKLNTALRNGRKNILYLVQSDFRQETTDSIGGTQLHVKDLCEGLRYQANVFVAARNLNYLNLTAYIDERDFCFQFYIGKAPEFPVFKSKEFAGLYEQILSYFSIDLVHIHHTLGLSLELFYQTKNKGIPLLVTLHDFYYICPTLKLLNDENQYCKGIANDAMCQRCLKKRTGINSGAEYIHYWRAESQNVLKMANQIILPSRSAKEIVTFYYPELQDKLIVIGHGSVVMPDVGRVIQSQKNRAAPFHIAFIGAISDSKGSYCASQLVKNGSLDIQWYLFGIYGHNDLSVVERSNFTKTGEYSRKELPDLLKKYQIDLICILSICPETFCYTISEAIMCGIPVIATDIGAIGERVRELKCGWLVPYQANHMEILNIINQIKNRGNEYQEKIREVRNAKIRTAKEMCLDYYELYQTHFKELSGLKLSVNTKHKFLENYLFFNSKGNIENKELLRHLRETETQLWNISHSTTYRIAQIISSIPFPFKKQIKEFLFGIYQKVK